MSFKFEKLEIPDVIHIQPDVYRDKRGFFAEIYKKKDFAEFGIAEEFVQINHSRSEKNVLRGMHCQLNPVAQGKLVSVFQGEIFDAVIDIRKGSPYFGKWVGIHLTAEKKNMLYVPPGFAHGFCVISEEAE
ncbi:MAG: dTDP-4-dehydrorhamnose 3,5-epimerase, partial [Candidatus Omnitrophica bacterium]|nr:dTDP-4-dehydrorhamnose 3,5-epimerase [Candidatus Omnitrophota bacterium]